MFKKIEYPEKHASYWAEKLELYIDDINWIEEYVQCTKWTISTGLCSFYYQFRMGDIMCNSKLVKMKKVKNTNCEWCLHHNASFWWIAH